MSLFSVVLVSFVEHPSVIFLVKSRVSGSEQGKSLGIFTLES